MQAGDIYMRFLSFANVAEWKKAITDKQPIKIDLGAYYNVPVSVIAHNVISESYIFFFWRRFNSSKCNLGLVTYHFVNDEIIHTMRFCHMTPGQARDKASVRNFMTM